MRGEDFKQRSFLTPRELSMKWLLPGGEHHMPRKASQGEDRGPPSSWAERRHLPCRGLAWTASGVPDAGSSCWVMQGSQSPMGWSPARHTYVSTG